MAKIGVRKIGLFTVMSGALGLTVGGEVQAVQPLLGTPMAVVLALVFALSTLLALHEVTVAHSKSARLWAWLVLVLAGGMELGLNTWHALSVGNLPTPAAIAVGAGPVVLAGLLSHLLTLSVDEQPAPAPAPVPVPPVAPVHPPRTDVAPVRRDPVADKPTPVRATAVRTGTPQTTRKAVAAGARTAPKAPRPDDELLAILSYPELVARDEDGTVPVRRAARELGCGVDRARKLLGQVGLLATGPDEDAPVPALSLVDAV
ncbi:hypothetical protein F4560_008715 [Saccharothrix ecbatanensis]|uniref:DUF2637 domain-containing protein n=1 Tax=Saccharothrix ecbatanensis TaxID=1105145 RepID=A0A7W9M658_9PSEU|nr:hypothetical protein [Saccharothrix ecbatanensis]MBB5808947.1 hypothetical protein [Saccharothrix ecbatanensis]